MLLGENPLPASLEIHVAKASQVAEVAGRLASVAEIEDIVYAGHVAEKLTRLSSFVEKLSIIISRSRSRRAASCSSTRYGFPSTRARRRST